MTPEQQAAEVLAAHEFIQRVTVQSGYFKACSCGEWCACCHAETHTAHVAAALAAAGVLRDPDNGHEAVDAEAAWLTYRDDYMRERPWCSPDRAGRQMRKREFIAGFRAAIEGAPK